MRDGSLREVGWKSVGRPMEVLCFLQVPAGHKVLCRMDVPEGHKVLCPGISPGLHKRHLVQGAGALGTQGKVEWPLESCVGRRRCRHTRSCVSCRNPGCIRCLVRGAAPLGARGLVLARAARVTQARDGSLLEVGWKSPAGEMEVLCPMDLPAVHKRGCVSRLPTRYPSRK